MSLLQENRSLHLWIFKEDFKGEREEKKRREGERRRKGEREGKKELTIQFMIYHLQHRNKKNSKFYKFQGSRIKKKKGKSNHNCEKGKKKREEVFWKPRSQIWQKAEESVGENCEWFKLLFLILLALNFEEKCWVNVALNGFP